MQIPKGFLLGLLAIAGCTAVAEPNPLGQPGTFAIKEISSQDTAEGTRKVWLAMVSDQAASPFQFQLEMLLKPLQGPLPMAFSKAAIIREKGKDGR